MRTKGPGVLTSLLTSPKPGRGRSPQPTICPDLGLSSAVRWRGRRIDTELAEKARQAFRSRGTQTQTTHNLGDSHPYPLHLQEGLSPWISLHCISQENLGCLVYLQGEVSFDAPAPSFISNEGLSLTPFSRGQSADQSCDTLGLLPSLTNSF